MVHKVSVPGVTVRNRWARSSWLVLFICFGGFAPQAFAQGVAFDRTDYSAGGQPSAVVIADFNGDGKLDLAVANFDSSNVSILLGTGNGTFSSPTNFSTGASPSSVATGDFNGDLKLDLVTANATDDSVSILLGNGDGTFGAPTNFATASTPVFVAVADFNGDTKLDLAVANRDSDSVSVLLGNGNGTFGAKTDFLTGAQPRWLIVADFNGDSKLDVASANPGSNTVSILLGNGDGTFATKSDFTTGSFPRAVAAADFRNLLRADLATANRDDNTASVLLSRGDGTFDPRNDLGTDTAPLAVTAADFDNDGKPDLLTSNVGQTFAYYTGAGYGCCYIYYTRPTVSLLRGNGDGTFSPGTNFGIGVDQSPVSVATADLNGDGRIDVVTANQQQGTVSVLLQVPAISLSTGQLDFPTNQAMGTTSPPQTLTVSSTGSFDLVIGTVSILGNNPGDFSKVGDTCSGVSVPSGSNCQVQVTFTPSVSGARNATLRIPDNAPGNPHDVNLFGAGVGNGAVSFSPTSLDFGDQFVGTTSAQRQVTLTNTGTGPITVLVVFPPVSNFLVGSACSAPLAVNASCTMAVAFAPTSLGPQAAQIRINSDTTGSPNFVSLTGNGIPAPIVTLNPASLTFADQMVGTTSAAQTVTLAVAGNTLTISSISASPGFNAVSNCGTMVADGGSCTISVTFQPAAGGSRLGAVTIVDNGPGSPRTVPLSGNGIVPPPSVMLSPTSLTFVAQVVGTTSAAQTIMLTNTGGSALNIANIVRGGTNATDFNVSNTCGASVAAGANCTITVTFAPQAGVLGARDATVTITDNAAGSPRLITLSGTVTDFSIMPASGSQTTMTINSGDTATFMLSLAGQGGFNGTVTFNCTGSIPAGMCVASPPSAMLGANPVTVTVSVTTMRRGASLPREWRQPPPLGWVRVWMLSLLLALSLLMLLRRQNRDPIPERRRAFAGAIPLAALLLAVVLSSSCGGGGGAAVVGTPAGTYPLTVSATSGGATRAVNLTVTVR